MDPDEITAKFKLNAARLLADNGCAALAALHAHNASSSLPLSPLHCPRCSHAPVSSRVIANPPKQRTRATSRTKNARRPLQSHESRGLRVRLIRSCAACGYVGAEAAERSDINEIEKPSAHSSSSSVPVSRTASPACPVSDMVTGKDITLETGAKLKGKATVQASQQSTIPSVSKTKALSQSALQAKRQKKKAGLQQMLARSKEQRSAAQKGDGQEGTGLAAFLSDL